METAVVSDQVTQPADQINLLTMDNPDQLNVISRRSRKQSQPMRLPDYNDRKDHNLPESDFSFTSYQLGLSPQSAPNEITASKTKGLKERRGEAFKKLTL